MKPFLKGYVKQNSMNTTRKWCKYCRKEMTHVNGLCVACGNWN